MAGHSLAAARSALVLGGIAALLLAGCQEEEAALDIEPRPIRTYTVSEAVGGMIRRYSGLSEASETTALSFPVAGTVEDIFVGIGDQIERDDVVAELDPEPFELEVQAAEAEVERARSDLVAKEGELERNRVLFEKGWVSQAAIEKHQAAYDAALSTVDYARSRLALVERNLLNATLLAPYAGTIAGRFVERFEDVAAAQTIVELNSTDGLLVAFAVPEVGINQVSLGQPVSVTFATLGPQELEGRITEIDTVASAGNSYTVKASILAPPEALRPGMSAQISISDPAERGQAGYLVPLSAIAPGEAENVGSVFKYDSDAGIVRQTPIQAEGVRENLVIVLEGVAPGDIIAAAGVSFLMDGQAVRLLRE